MGLLLPSLFGPLPLKIWCCSVDVPVQQCVYRRHVHGSVVGYTMAGHAALQLGHVGLFRKEKDVLSLKQARF